MTSNTKLTPEEEANAKRDAERVNQDKDPSVVETLNKPLTSIVSPLVDQEPDPEDLARGREENDAESRA